VRFVTKDLKGQVVSNVSKSKQDSLALALPAHELVEMGLLIQVKLAMMEFLLIPKAVCQTVQVLKLAGLVLDTRCLLALKSP